MKHFYVPAIVVCVLLGMTFFCSGSLSIVSQCTASDSVVFEAGTAAVEITPPLSFPMSGYYNVRLSEGSLDPLLAKALVFRQGDSKSAVVICDVIALNRTWTDAVRKQAAELTGIPQAAIVVAGTHTHTGPVRNPLRADTTEESNRLAVENNDHDAFDYGFFFVGRVVSAIVEAQKNLRPATIRSGKANVPDLSFNRRFFMKNNDQVVFNPGIKNPNIIRPAGPIDPSVGLIMFVDSQTGKPFASLTNFALHLDTTGGLKFSADYPFYLSNVLKSKYGDSFMSVFGTGTCGDINHLDVSGATRRRAPEIGTKLGEYVAAALENSLKDETPSLKAVNDPLTYPRQHFNDDDMAAAKVIQPYIYNPGDSGYTFLQRVKAGKVINSAHKPDKLQLEVQAIRLSDDTAIVTLPGEIFVDLGLEIKQKSPFANTLVIELSQNDVGYIPTQKAFDEGSYETINSYIQPGGGEKIVETALKCLNQIK